MSGSFGVVESVALLALFAVVLVSIIRSARSLARRVGDVRRFASAAQPEISGLSLILQHNDPRTLLEQLVQPLRIVDPSFSAPEFLASASSAFVRTSESKGDDTAALPVTAGLAEHLVQQAQTWSKAGFIAVTSGVKIENALISGVRVDSHQQATDVRLEGTWTHYIAPASGGEPVEGSAAPVPFAQIATFVRPAGATTAKMGKPAGIGSGSVAAATPLATCPQCGADVVRGVAVCPYCAARLDQSGAPWLLDNIRPDATAAVAPVSARALSATIGMVISGQGAGDSAPTTIAFGKNLRAAIDQIVASDARFSQDRFLSWATQTYLARRQAQSLPDLTVRKAEIFCVVISQATQNILVLFQSTGGDGISVVEGAVFGRRPGIVTPTSMQPVNHVCASCGAPISAGATSCASCGTPVPDSTGGWKLEMTTQKGLGRYAVSSPTGKG